MTTKRWRVGLNGTAFTGMYLIHPDGHCGPEYRLGDSTHGYVTHEDAKALEAEIERLKIIESLSREMISEMRLTPDGLIVKEKADKSDAHYRLCELLWPRPKVLRHNVYSQVEPSSHP